MSTTQNSALFSEHKVTPDVLSSDADLSYTLTVSWPETKLDRPAEELDRNQTQPQPKLSLSPPPSKPLKNLVLVMTDPDLMMNDDTYFGQVRHWLVSNVSTDSDGSLNIAQGKEISSYLGPAPLPNYLYSRPHRYVFIVASGSGQVDITPEDLQELQQPYVAAISGKQGEVQDLKDRWGFNAQNLIEKKGLKVEAVNFMRVHGTLGSAATNAGLMGQAAINKILGK
ncbi:PEBP-like protein [Macroventuria anomochaeta]|uniref:PEBP-like protein n=1 Tax=Macroventuria anomochaeta TaxID=301207 RepID=A0ACB6RRI9_9PLEO|nr:PEBP-like protein [Macroventuria anomochaeta]KAF2624317.1 PEBP-like protein [Macroventuria anomochaeta]